MSAVVTPRVAVALFLVALAVLGLCAKCPGLGPRQWERTTGTAPVVVREAAHVPAPESSAAMVRRQLIDARGGTP